MQTLFCHYPDVAVFWGVLVIFLISVTKYLTIGNLRGVIYFGSWFAGIVQPGREGLVAGAAFDCGGGSGRCFSHLD